MWNIAEMLPQMRKSAQVCSKCKIVLQSRKRTQTLLSAIGKGLPLSKTTSDDSSIPVTFLCRWQYPPPPSPHTHTHTHHHHHQMPRVSEASPFSTIFVGTLRLAPPDVTVRLEDDDATLSGYIITWSFICMDLNTYVNAKAQNITTKLDYIS